MEYYKGEYNFRSSGTLLGIAYTLILSTALIWVAYRSFQFDSSADIAPWIIGACLTLIAILLIAVAIGHSMSFLRSRRLSVVISSEGIQLDSNLTPWEEV